MSQQKNLFSQSPTKRCERCSKLCRVAEKRNPKSQLFVKGDRKTGRYCAECLVVDFLLNCDYGPQLNELAKLTGPGPGPFDATRTFDPEVFRLPHVQEQFAAIVLKAQEQYSAELMPDEFDWLEVIANWHLPFPKRTKRAKGG